MNTAERFWSHVDKSGDCWLWTGGRSWAGYGHFNIGGHGFYSHRWAYENVVGPIPEGLVLDHLCRTPLCVNPAHLEPVTNRENILRGTSPSALNSTVTACPKGHEYTADNTYTDRHGKRTCRTCQRERATTWKHKVGWHKPGWKGGHYRPRVAA